MNIHYILGTVFYWSFIEVYSPNKSFFFIVSMYLEDTYRSYSHFDLWEQHCAQLGWSRGLFFNISVTFLLPTATQRPQYVHLHLLNLMTLFTWIVVTVGVTGLWESTDPPGTKGGVELRDDACLRSRASSLNGSSCSAQSLGRGIHPHAGN